jgi:hypothetical protein
VYHTFNTFELDGVVFGYFQDVKGVATLFEAILQYFVYTKIKTFCRQIKKKKILFLR